MRTPIQSTQAGFTFIELLFVSVISVMVFGALFATFQFTLQLIAQSRAQLSALSLANERMEFFRSLPYNDVGTLTGIVRGPVANNQVLTFNGIAFTERIVIDYVDGPGDTVAGVDKNAILEDYKQIKLEYTWSVNGQNYNLALVSDIMPRAIETGAGGGSVQVSVFDQDFLPLPGARVQISNASATAPLYELRLSDVNGQVLLSGVPVDSNYQIVVGGPIGGVRHSTSTTHIADASIPNPSNPAFFVSEGGIASQPFFIGELSDITLTAFSAINEGSDLFPFVDASNIASSSNTAVVTGDLVLVDTLGVFALVGTAYLDAIVPPTLTAWETIRIGADLDPGTDYVVRLYVGDALGGYTPIPDAALPGNALGFTDSLIDISALDVFLYPTTTVGITLTTANPAETPDIEEIEVFWREGTTPRAGQSLAIRGDKIIGTDTAGIPIYKTTATVVTDASGEVALANQEFDRYTVTPVGSADLASACPGASFVHRAGVDSAVELVYVAGAAATLRVSVLDPLGRPVPGSSVRLDRVGYDVTQPTNVCGQTFFTGGVAAETDYELTVSVAGFATQVISPFEVSGDTTVTITLVP